MLFRSTETVFPSHDNLVGHLMQGIGSVNMSMGSAATGQPIDISGALQWNPAGITDFNGNTVSVNAGLFMSNPELSSSYGLMSGVTKDEKANSIMPAVAVTFGKNPHHKFGISVFGVSGFGVEYPESTTNPILMSQQYGGFGKVESNYMLMQVGFAYAYKFNENFSMASAYRDWETDRKSTRLNSSHRSLSRMPSSA